MPIKKIKRQISIHKERTNVDFDGTYKLQIKELNLTSDEEVTIKGQRTLRDILTIKGKTEGGVTLSRRFIFVLTANSELGKLIEAVVGEIPDEISDLEELLLNKWILVDVKNNVKNGIIYSNIIGFHPAPEQEEEAEVDVEDSEEDPNSDISDILNLDDDEDNDDDEYDDDDDVCFTKDESVASKRFKRRRPSEEGESLDDIISNLGLDD